uniref:Mediator of RNA polymerase II transcription subunit 27 n=1 Tax=Aceria tosichella TaxID=561515 RepID=A0A6G1SK14_9ACAR
MDAATKKKLKDQTIHQTGEACANMIVGIRQLRLSVLDLFNTIANTGVDPEKNHQQYQHQLQAQHQNMTHHHQQQQQHQSSNPNSKLYNQQTISTLATSHTLCTASNPPPIVQKQLEHRQQTDLIQYVDQMISSITNIIRGLDQDVAILMQNNNLINAGESVQLGMDSSLDKHNLFMDLCSSYKTLSRLHDYSANCHALLHQQSLKRVHKRLDAPMNNQHQQNSALASQHLMQQLQPSQQSSLAAARSESVVATFNPYIYKICPSKVTSMLENLLKNFEHLEGAYSQPFGISTGVLQISINKVLKAILLMRGIVIDAVIVKAHHESFSNRASRTGTSASLLAAYAYDQSASNNSVNNQFVDPDTDEIDLWSESKYNVFRRLTHQANAAVLHFQYPTVPEIAVKTFLAWFNSYSNLFTATCSRCNTRLRKFMPPICRDFCQGFHAHHDSCR